MVSTVVAVLALTAACLVSSSSAQAQGATIKCYYCGSDSYANTGDYGCGSTITATGSNANMFSAWNATAVKQVTCTGQCVKAVAFSATAGSSGSSDSITRGCTTTTPAVGCYASDFQPGTTICVSVCSTDLCNSAVSLTQSLVVSTVGLLVAILNFRRK